MEKVEVNPPKQTKRLSLNQNTKKFQVFKDADKVYLNTSQSSFSNMVLEEHTIFVDKSLLIKQVLDDSSHSRFILRPRRFGKSLNMSMLNDFFEHEVDQEGKVKQNQQNLKLFTGGDFKLPKKTIKLRPLKIATLGQKSNKYLNQQGSYPTIYITFGKIDNQNFKEAKEQIAQVFYDAFKNKKFLASLNYKRNAENNIKEYKNYMAALQNIINKKEEDSNSIRALKRSLAIMSELYYDFFEMESVILIDQYDQPYQNILTKIIGNNEQELQETGKFIGAIMKQVFKDAKIVKRAIATGVMDTLITNQYSGLNNISKNSIMDSRYSAFFGFTKDEVQLLVTQLFKTQGQYEQDKNQLLNGIKHYYNGYVAGQLTIYNPFDVMCYLDQCVTGGQIQQCRSYWSQNGGHLLLLRAFSSYKNKKALGKIISLISCPSQINPYPTVQFQFVQRPLLYSSYFRTDTEIPQNILTHLLIHIGYITGQKQGDWFNARIPNYQIYKTIKQNFQSWAKENLFNNDLSNINIQDPRDFQVQMQKAINQTKDCIGLKNEIIFQMIILMRYTKSLKPTHKVSLELDSGAGRIDIYLESQQKRSAIIIELKYITSVKKMNKTFQDILWQIYGTLYLTYPITKAKLYQNIDQIIVRPVIILNNCQKISVLVEEDIVHTIQEAKNINFQFQMTRSQSPDIKLNRLMLQKLKQRMPNKYHFQDIKSYILSFSGFKQQKQGKIQQRYQELVRKIIVKSGLNYEEGIKLQTNLALKFPTIFLFVEASVESLQQIDGVKPQLADKIFRYLQIEKQAMKYSRSKIGEEIIPIRND